MDVLQWAVWKNTHIENSLKVTDGRCVQITTLFGQRFVFLLELIQQEMECSAGLEA